MIKKSWKISKKLGIYLKFFFWNFGKRCGVPSLFQFVNLFFLFVWVFDWCIILSFFIIVSIDSYSICKWLLFCCFRINSSCCVVVIDSLVWSLNEKIIWIYEFLFVCFIIRRLRLFHCVSFEWTKIKIFFVSILAYILICSTWIFFCLSKKNWNDTYILSRVQLKVYCIQFVCECVCLIYL